MLAQVMWLFISYALALSASLVLLEMRQVLWFLLAVLLFPAVRIYRRWDPRRGYYIVGRHWGSQRVVRRSFRVTKQEFPKLFTLMLLAELAIVSFVYVAAFSSSSFVASAPVHELVVSIQCRFGGRFHEDVCFLTH
jgi:hypothetical protein